MDWLNRFVSRLSPSLRYRRLEADIEDARLEFARIRARGQEAWHNDAELLLRRALDVGRVNVDEGWYNLLTARRLLIAGYEEHEWESGAVALRAEAEQKLQGWRRAAVTRLLGQHPDALGSAPTRSRALLQRAMQIRDEALQNEYFGNAIRFSQLKVLFPWLLIIVVALLTLSYWGKITIGKPEEEDVFVLLEVVLFGTFGGTFSAILTITRSGSRSRIPDQQVQGWLTLMRPVLGASAAVAVYFVVQSKIVDFGDLRLEALYVLSFASGFSERLILGAVEGVEKRFPSTAGV